MALVTTLPSQVRITQAVAVEEDGVGAEDVGQIEVEAAVDAAEAVGYIGTVPEEGS